MQQTMVDLMILSVLTPTQHGIITCHYDVVSNTTGGSNFCKEDHET